MLWVPRMLSVKIEYMRAHFSDSWPSPLQDRSASSSRSPRLDIFFLGLLLLKILKKNKNYERNVVLKE